MSLLLFSLSFFVGYLYHRRKLHLNFVTDYDEVEELAVAIRKGKEEKYDHYLANLPSCAICGPGIRHSNVHIK